MSRSWLGRSAAVTAAWLLPAGAASCGESAPAEIDAGPPLPSQSEAFECLGGEEPPPGARAAGELALATKDGTFEAIGEDEEIPIISSAGQGTLVHLEIWPRMRALDPGDPERNGAPENPLTRISLFEENGERADLRDCHTDLPYRNQKDGYWDLGTARNVLMNEERAEQLVGERLRLVGEVLDADYRYARAEVWITAGEFIAED